MKTLEAQRKAIEANFGVAHSMAIRTKEQEVFYNNGDGWMDR